jgi:hypothetical protein
MNKFKTNKLKRDVCVPVRINSELYEKVMTALENVPNLCGFDKPATFGDFVEKAFERFISEYNL